MFGLGKKQSGKSDVAVVEPQVKTSVPSARTPEAELGELELAEYRKLSMEVGFRPAALVREELVDFLRRSEIGVYNLDEVTRFLTEKFGEGDKYKGGAKWAWIPLRESDVGKLTNHLSWFQNGTIVEGQYERGVPLHVLALVKKVSSEVPEAVFYVADDPKYSSVQDPFLGVLARGMRMMVIAQWDEPGFNGKAKPIE